MTQPSTESVPAARVSYGTWGEEFFATAISEDRILGAVRDLAGQPIAFGPIGVGPGRLAKVTAHGQIGDAVATRRTGAPITLDLRVPVDLTFEVDLRLEQERYAAHLELPIVLVAHALEGVRIQVEAVPPRPADISVRVEASGGRARLLQVVAGIDDELRRFVAKYVARELDKPHVRAAREIDVAGLIDRAWSARPDDADDS